MSKINKELLAKIKEVTARGLPFMVGKEQAEIVAGQVYNIKHIGYLEGMDKVTKQSKEFVVMADEEHFYFGGSVVTTNFKELEEVLSPKEIEQLFEEGLTIKFTKNKSKATGNDYTSCEFFPDSE